MNKNMEVQMSFAARTLRNYQYVNNIYIQYTADVQINSGLVIN